MRIKLGIFSLNERMGENREKWKEYLQIMDGICIPKQPVH
jgi:hypothetical protein